MRKASAVFLAALWLGLAAACWLKPADTASVSERRPLAQRPALTGESLLSGRFTADFETYTMDQFPAREGFRTLKALSHYGLLGQRDNNGIYLTKGQAAALTDPLWEKSAASAAAKLTALYERYLQGEHHRVVLSVVPDKGYYLARQGGWPAMDYERLFAMMRLPFAVDVDLTDTLSAADYYPTDTHWRQECLLPAAEKLAGALGVALAGDFTPEDTGIDFYGVYAGQAALPLPPDRLTLMTSPTLSECTVRHAEGGKATAVYDREKLTSRDPYEVYLSGASAVVTVENPCATGKLVIFRDSFGSSLAPLLIPSYGEVVLVDTRYIDPALVGDYVEFTGADVLFLYSTLLLVGSGAMK